MNPPCSRKGLVKFKEGYQVVDGLKQRVVGALVLISLAVIFIPMLFDEPHQERTSKVLPIPAKPALPSVQIGEPKPLQLLSEVAPEEPAPEASPGFVLMELDEDKESVTPVAKPAPTPTQAAEPVAVTPVAAAERAAPVKTPSVAAPVNKTPVSDEAWTVQIGTFKNHENAYRLRDTVVTQGLKGYTQEITTDEGTLVRVFAGPVLSNDEAQELKQKVEKLLGMKSLVVRYKP